MKRIFKKNIIEGIFLIAILLVSTLLFGCHSEPDYDGHCDSCRSGIYENNSVKLREIGVYCHLCISDMIIDLQDGKKGICKNCGCLFDNWWREEYVELCERCGWELLHSCDWCGKETHDWAGIENYRLCKECMTILMNDQKFVDAFFNAITVWQES